MKVKGTQSFMYFLVVMSLAALNWIQHLSVYTKEKTLNDNSRTKRNLDIMHQEQGEDQPAASNSVGSANDVINNISLTTTKHDSSTAVPRQEIEMGVTGIVNTNKEEDEAPSEELATLKQELQKVTQLLASAAASSDPPLLNGLSGSGHDQIQDSHVTAFNRYPEEYSFAKQYFDDHLSTKTDKKLLSFGASTGEEAITLATKYFIGIEPTVYGVDLDQRSLNKAQQNIAHNEDIEDGKITLFNGKDTYITEYGPYDAIFANSVLCFNGKRTKPHDIVERFSFEKFEGILNYLDSSLNVGGLLSIVNTNYHFSDSDIAKRYKPLTKCPGNFVKKVDKDTVQFVDADDSLDCVWVKES